MNKIIFAGTKSDLHGALYNKYFEFIIPEKGGQGINIAANGAACSLGWEEIAVIPPNYRYNLTAFGAKDIHIYLDQALLPIKELFTMTDVKNEGIRHVAEQLVVYFNSEYEKKDVVLAALGNLLVGYVTLTLGEGKKFTPVVENVRSDIESNVSNTTYSLEDSLRKMPLNYDYVRKLFKKETGLTPHEYLVSKRMELAYALLTSGVTNRYSNYSVSQVAEACGFSEPLYFSRVFKKRFGKSPSDYLKK